MNGFTALAVLSLLTFGTALGADSAGARLQKIEDRQAIEQLLMGDYPRALDSNNWAAYAALFAKDGTLIMGGGSTKLTGPAAIQQYFGARPTPAPAASMAPSPCPVPPRRP
jgi:SnoaL-like domain